ncbi:hypothetical protein pb186bvf_000964 [Paramecium bursaria]
MQKTQRFLTLHSFARDKSFIKVNKEILVEEIQKLQETSKFEHFPEFNDVKENDLIISIRSSQMKNFTPFQQLDDDLDNRIQELIYNIRRKYPWITVVEKKISEREQNCQIQIYSKKYQLVISNKPFQSTQHILDIMKVYIDKGLVNINIVCNNDTALPIGGKLINIYQGKITLVQKDKANLIKNNQPAKLLTQSLPLTGQSVSFSVPINDYFIEIEGKYIKNYKADVKMGDNNIVIERNDLQLTTIQVLNKTTPIDAQVKVNNIPIQYDGQYKFWAKIGQEYAINISKPDFYPITEVLYIQGTKETVQSYELIQKTRASLKINVRNILDGEPLDKVTLLLDGQIMGQTNANGALIINNLEFKLIKIQATKRGFLTIPLEFDLKANSIGETADIILLPDYFSLVNQFHIIIVKPKTTKDLVVQLKRNNEIYQSQPQIVKSKLGDVINHSIHMKNIDVFNKEDNIYHVSLMNKNFVQSIVAQSESMKSTHLNLKSSIFQTRISIHQSNTDRSLNKRENSKIIKTCKGMEKIKVYLTYGMDVISSIQIDVEQIENRVYAKIDLNTRIVEIEGQKYEQEKKKKVQQKPYLPTSNILKQITNGI